MVNWSENALSSLFHDVTLSVGIQFLSLVGMHIWLHMYGPVVHIPNFCTYNVMIILLSKYGSSLSTVYKDGKISKCG